MSTKRLTYVLQGKYITCGNISITVLDAELQTKQMKKKRKKKEENDGGLHVDLITRKQNLDVKVPQLNNFLSAKHY